MQIAYPFQIDEHGLIAEAGADEHIVQMIEQVLFTAPGERVNRPDFGCGLLSFLFRSPNTEVLTALEGMLQGSLQRWLGDLIQVEGVTVQMEDSTLNVMVRYSVLGSRSRGFARFSRQMAL
jgi:phage baseplate assembly protein W